MNGCNPAVLCRGSASRVWGGRREWRYILGSEEAFLVALHFPFSSLLFLLVAPLTPKAFTCIGIARGFTVTFPVSSSVIAVLKCTYCLGWRGGGFRDGLVGYECLLD